MHFLNDSQLKYIGLSFFRYFDSLEAGSQLIYTTYLYNYIIEQLYRRNQSWNFDKKKCWYIHHNPIFNCLLFWIVFVTIRCFYPLDIFLINVWLVIEHQTSKQFWNTLCMTLFEIVWKNIFYKRKYWYQVKIKTNKKR